MLGFPSKVLTKATMFSKEREIRVVLPILPSLDILRTTLPKNIAKTAFPFLYSKQTEITTDFSSCVTLSTSIVRRHPGQCFTVCGLFNRKIDSCKSNYCSTTRPFNKKCQSRVIDTGDADKADLLSKASKWSPQQIASISELSLNSIEGTQNDVQKCLLSPGSHPSSNRTLFDSEIVNDISENRALSLSIAEEALLNQHRQKGLEVFKGGPIDRYLPPRDPSLFLIDREKLTLEERRYQVLFAVLPWVMFAFLCAFPFLLLLVLIPYLEQRKMQRPENIWDIVTEFLMPPYQLVHFPAMLDIVERPYPTLVFYFHPKKLASNIIGPFIHDLANLLSEFSVGISVVALDLSGSDVPKQFLKNVPIHASPHLQLIIPYALNGDAAVTTYTGCWSSKSILDTISSYVPIPQLLYERAKRLDNQMETVSDCLFKLLFVDDSFFEENATLTELGEVNTSNALSLVSSKASQKFFYLNDILPLRFTENRQSESNTPQDHSNESENYLTERTGLSNEAAVLNDSPATNTLENSFSRCLLARRRLKAKQ